MRQRRVPFGTMIVLRIGASLLTVSLLLFFLTAITAAKTTLTYYIWENGPVHELQEFIENSSFAKENPDIEIEIMTRSLGRVEQLLVWHAAGVTPDIIDVNDEVLVSLAGLGILEPLDSYLEADDDVSADVFHAPALDAMSFDGQLLALPQALQVLAVYQNKDMFLTSGLRPFEGSEPWTWEDFENVARRLKRMSPDGNITQYGAWIRDIPIRNAHLFWSAGVNFWSPDGSESLMNSPEAVETLGFIQSMVDQEIIPRDAGSGDSRHFLEGRLGMLFEGSWKLRGSFVEDAYHDIVVAAPPRHREQATFGACAGLAMSQSTKNKDAAWRFIKFMTTDPEALSNRVVQRLQIPATREHALDWLEIMRSTPGIEGTETFVEILPTARWYKDIAPPGISANLVFDTWRKELRPIWQGTESHLVVADNLKRALDALVSE